MPKSVFKKKLAFSLLASSMFIAPAMATPQDDLNAPTKWMEHENTLVIQAEGASDDEKGSDDKKPLSLKTERNIEFETDEATWLSLDVSPDGQTIIFELLGDIYTLPVDGGEATRILSGIAFQSQPVYSPDGTEIAFLSDEGGSENLYVANADGTKPRKLSSMSKGEGMSPEWSADGDYVYMSQLSDGIGAAEIWMYHKNGGKGVQITKSRVKGPSTPRSQQPNAKGVSASSDGRYLYYAAKRGGFEYNMRNFSWRVVRRDLKEGTVDTIVTAYGGAVRPVISPDGNTLVYGTRHEENTGLRVRNLETGEDRWLAYPITRDDQESRSTRDLLPSYSFTPDGSAIITTSGGKIERINIADGARVGIPFTAKVQLDVGPNLIYQDEGREEGPVVARMVQRPSLSPDGSQVLFSALGELYSMDLEEGAKPRKIERAGNQAFQPAWSNDGRYITYVSWEAGGGHVWRMRADGRSRPKRMTSVAGYYTEPGFTPDGSEIVAIRSSQFEFNQGSSRNQRDLVALDKDGNIRTILSGSRLSGIHFGEATDRIYVYGSNGLFSSGAKLFSIRLDGTDRREHLTVKGTGLYANAEPVTARDIRLSPNGKYALAVSQQQLHVMSVPTINRDGQDISLGSPSIPLKTLSNAGADYFDWSKDGQTILWSVGSTIHTQALADVEWVKSEKEDKPAEDADTAENSEAEAEKAEEPKAYKTYAARVEVPRDNPEGTILLRGATAITMGPKGAIENADILVKDGVFVAVGEANSLDVPRGAEVRDMSGKFITPGFVDSHGHWRNWSRNEVIEEHFWPFLANLSYGVTSGLDVQTSTTDIFVYQDLVEAGRMMGMRAWSTGPGVFSDTVIKSKDQAKEILSRYKNHYRTKNIKSYIVGNRKQRHHLLAAAKELGIMPTTEGGLDAKLDLTHIIDGYAGNEHNLPIIPLYKDITQLAAQTGVGYTPTLLVTYGGPAAENHFFTNMNPHDDVKINRFTPHYIIDGASKRRSWFRAEEYSFPRVADSAIGIQRAGGKVGVGSHGQFQGLGFHWEMWALGSGNAKPMEVLKAATIDGAHIIGHANEVGSIEAGKYADLVILNSDPRVDLKNTTDIHRVMMNGRMYNDDTLGQEWPEQKTLPKLWFHDQDPK